MRARVAAVLAIVIGSGALARADWGERLGSEARLEALRSTDRHARREAARWLGRHGERAAVVGALIEQLEVDADPDVRAEIAAALGRHADPRAVIALAGSVASMRPGEREARLRALAAIDDPLARRALAESLAGPGASIARPLLIDAGASVIDALAPLLAVPTVAPRAAEALGAIGDPRSAEALAGRAGDADPATRAAVLDAIGAIGAREHAALALAALEDPDPAVVAAALRAIGAIGTIEASGALEERTGHADPAIAIAAWRSWLAIDPDRAAPAIERAADPAIRAAIRAAILESPHPAMLEALVALAREGGAGCDALARLEDPRGAIALTELARAGSEPARLALAIALRAGRDAPGAIDALDAEPDPLRRAWLRAIAGRGATLDPAPLDPIARTILARAIDPARLESAIAAERDPIALEALARALVERGGSIDPEVPLAILEPAAEPARIVLASIARRSGSAEIEHAIARSIFEGARARAPRSRAIAIEALARRGEGATTIAAAIEDPSADVRLAAARALARTGPRASIERRLRSRLAVEGDPRVRRAIRDAIARAAPASGERCLAIALARRGAPEPVVVEIVLEDGRWLRERTLPGGELVLCGLADGEADVRVPA